MSNNKLLKPKILACAAMAALALSATGAQARPMKFVLTGAGYHSMTWYHDSNPTPRQVDTNHWTAIDVVGVNPIFGNAYVATYYDPAYYAPNESAFTLSYESGFWFSYRTSPLFTGTESAPVFHSGVFSLTPNGNTLPGIATLTISPTAPAPLAGGGLLAALAALTGFALTRLRTLGSGLGRLRRA